MLRQPLENEKVTISRVHSTVTYPAKFIFIAAMNPCPCGYVGSSQHYCTCSEKQIKAYQNRVPGPIDYGHRNLPPVPSFVPLFDKNLPGLANSLSIKNSSHYYYVIGRSFLI
jgi:hypothetical protein